VFLESSKFFSEASATLNLQVFWMASALGRYKKPRHDFCKLVSHHFPSLAKEGVSKLEAGGKVCAGDSLKRFRVSNGQKVILPDVWRNGDVCQEVEMNREWQKFLQLKQVYIGNERDVHDQRELHGLGIIQVGYFHLKEVPFLCHRESVIENFAEDIMRESSRSQVMMLGRFDDVFMMMHHRLKFLFDSL
jgi:hypothetical protein